LAQQWLTAYYLATIHWSYSLQSYCCDVDIRIIQGERRVPVHLYKNGVALRCKREIPKHKTFLVAYVTSDTCPWRPLRTLIATPNYCIFIHCDFHSNLYPTSDRCTGTLGSLRV
jgi:hypothetical protein